MGLAFTLGLSAILVWLTVAVVTSPRWVARRAHRHRLWRLRDQFVDALLDGDLPADHPAVVQVLRRIESTIDHCFKITLLAGVILTRLSRALTPSASREMRQQTADCDTKGLTAQECDLLTQYSERLVVLQAGSLLLGSWLGVVAVLIGAGRLLRHRGAIALRQRLSTATDEVTRSTRIGRLACEVAEKTTAAGLA